jgi:uncharacterized membrane protein
MTQWYDSWVGLIVSGSASVFVYIGNAASKIPVVGGGLNTFFTDLGCIIGFIVLIIVFVALLLVILWIIRWVRG